MDREQLEKALPKSAPDWVKRNPLATISTVVTTLAAAVAIFAWLGWKPITPLSADEAYVTHEQFNLLMINLVKSVEKIEKEVGSLKTDVQTASEMAEILLLDKIDQIESSMAAEEEEELPAPVLAEEIETPPTIHLSPNETPAPVLEEIVVAPIPIPIEPNIEVSPDPVAPLRGAVEKIESLQMEQRALRK